MQGISPWVIVFWTLTIALIELLRVPAWRALRVSVAFPLLMAVAFLLDPPVAGAVALVASFDLRELRREITVGRALVNRARAGVAVLAASAAFHAFGRGVLDPLPGVAAIALLAVLAYAAVTVAVVAADARLAGGAGPGEALRRLGVGRPVEFALSYLALGLLGLLLARLHEMVGFWPVALFVLPLLLVRGMLWRGDAREDGDRELREVALRNLSNRLAEERQDERSQIAGYLHDDLAQILYRMSLHIDISKKHISSGDLDRAVEELEAIKTSKDRTLILIRSLIKDLRRSPIGRMGLTEAIHSYCGDIDKDFGLQSITDLQDVEMPAPIQVLCFQVTREAIMNVVKHAEASHVRVTLAPAEDGARVTIADDGVGFDPDREIPEGHFGLAIMRDRTQATGGSLDIRSAPGEGTTVVAEFRTAWLSAPEDIRGLRLGGSDRA